MSQQQLAPCAWRSARWGVQLLVEQFSPATCGLKLWHSTRNPFLFEYSGPAVCCLQLPRVEKGRPGAWASDKEFGRQQLAGGNPCDLVALTELPAARGSAITPEHVDGEQEAAVHCLVARSDHFKLPA